MCGARYPSREEWPGAEQTADTRSQLTISTNAVRHHVRNLLAKLAITTRTEAVHVAMQRLLIR